MVNAIIFSKDLTSSAIEGLQHFEHPKFGNYYSLPLQVTQLTDYLIKLN
jgi:hypothetical protein